MMEAVREPVVAAPDVSELSRDRRIAWLVTLGLLLFYLPVQSGYWPPTSDGTYYLAIARSIAEGQGLTHNGEPAPLVPPGWPLVLATVMSVLPSFWLLGGLCAVLMAAGGGCWYYVLRMHTSRGIALAATLTAAGSYTWFYASYNMMSEAAFTALLGMAMLAALSLARRGGDWWRLPLVALICVGMIAIRWVGIVMVLPVVAMLVDGQSRPRWNRAWLRASLVLAAALLAFVGLQLDRHHRLAAAASTISARRIASLNTASAQTKVVDDTQADHAANDDVMASVATNIVGKRSSNLSISVARFLQSGRWLVGLACEPAELGRSIPIVAWVTNGMGWVLWAMFLVTIVRQHAGRRWIWLAVGASCMLLIVRWHRPAPRYLMPLAPALLAGVGIGALSLLSRIRSARWERATRVIAVAAWSGIVLLNFALYGVEVYIARSSDFSRAYYSGYAHELGRIARHLEMQGVRNGEIVVSAQYSNLGNVRRNSDDGSYGVRVLNFLMDRRVDIVTTSVCIGEPTPQLAVWAKQRGVRFYVYRPPVSPWRVWHFRAPALQQWVTGADRIANNPSWELYELDDSGIFRRVTLDGDANDVDWPHAVPHLRDRLPDRPRSAISRTPLRGYQ
jgi:4-amino-4-deoxy-L-arabinose transferase-like glycosyltransferase